MFDLWPHHSPNNSAAGMGHAIARPRFLPGETVEGWVVAEITPYPRPFRPVHLVNAAHRPESFIIGQDLSHEPVWEALSALSLAQFVLAVVEYPSGPVSRWGPLRWPAVEIILRSPHEWPAASGDAPTAIPAFSRWVDELARQALAQGWESAGCGRTWCSRRFRRRYADLRGVLRWK